MTCFSVLVMQDDIQGICPINALVVITVGVNVKQMRNKRQQSYIFILFDLNQMSQNAAVKVT